MIVTRNIQKTIFYIFIQLITLWSIFNQLSTQEEQSLFENAGLLILVGVLFLYAHKTIKLLTQCNIKFKEEQSEKLAL